MIESDTFSRIIDMILSRPPSSKNFSSSNSSHHSSSSNSYHVSSRHHSNSLLFESSSSTMSLSSSSSQSGSSFTYAKSPPKSPKNPPHILVLTRNGMSHCIECDGDPYDSEFKQEFDDFCEKYLLAMCSTN